MRLGLKYHSQRVTVMVILMVKMVSQTLKKSILMTSPLMHRKAKSKLRLIAHRNKRKPLTLLARPEMTNNKIINLMGYLVKLLRKKRRRIRQKKRKNRKEGHELVMMCKLRSVTWVMDAGLTITLRLKFKRGNIVPQKL